MLFRSTPSRLPPPCSPNGNVCVCLFSFLFFSFQLNFVQIFFFFSSASFWTVRRMASRCPTTRAGCCPTSCSTGRTPGPWRSPGETRSCRRCGTPSRAGTSARGATSTTGEERSGASSGPRMKEFESIRGQRSSGPPSERVLIHRRSKVVRFGLQIYLADYRGQIPFASQ